MLLSREESTPPIFEIDAPNEFGQFLLTNRQEVIFFLQLLWQRHSMATAYLDDGQQFFATSIVAVDEADNLLYLDPSAEPAVNQQALAARQITVVAKLDRVKMQFRLSALATEKHQDRDILCASLPASILRLQRREYFRLEPPLAAPIRCKLAAPQGDAENRIFELLLSDISGGGISLVGATEDAADFPRDALFQNCRLEIPGEGVLQVNLRVRKVIEISDRNGEHSLRIGCEFVNLPGSRQAFIERYIARIERERKARNSEPAGF